MGVGLVRARILGAMFFASFLCVAQANAQANTERPVAELSATVSSQVQQDQVQLVLSTQVQDTTPEKVNRRLVETINKARERLGEVQGVRISTGAVQTFPQYGKNGKITGWQGRSELVLRSLDVAATTAAADQVVDLLALSGVNFSLSDQVRQAEQARLMDAVAQAFRDKATSTARVFGYSGFQIKRLNISDSGEMPAPRIMAMAMSDAAEKTGLKLEPGLQTVSVTVTGQIELR